MGMKSVKGRASVFGLIGWKMNRAYVSRGEHELCMSTAYDGTTKLDSIWRLFCVTYRGGRPTDMDDGRAGLEKAKSLGWLVACLWDDEHDSYEWVC